MGTGSQGRGQKPGMGTSSQRRGQEARDGNWQPEMVTGSQGRGIVVTDGKSSHKRAKFPQAGQVPACGNWNKNSLKMKAPGRNFRYVND